MSIITKMRKQTAVWWGQMGQSPDGTGQPVLAAPVEISCRWEDSQKEYIKKDGTNTVSNAVVYVDRDMEVGDLLRLGPISSLTDLTAEGAKNNSSVFEVAVFEKLPNLKNTENLRTCLL